MDADALRARLEADPELVDETLADLRFPELDGDAPLRFENVDFERVDLTAADLGGARLVGCSFRDCTLDRIRLSDAELVRTRFYDADAGRGCTLYHADLEGARFNGCDLSLCELKGGHAWDLVLEDCTAQGLVVERVDFSRHPSRQLTLTAFTAARCNLSFAELTGLHLAGTTLAGSRLREAVLDDVDLTDADLSGCDLSAVRARRVTLVGADLRDAHVEGLDPGRVALDGARIRAWQARALLEAMGVVVED